jgi:ATP-dependent Lon protease
VEEPGPADLYTIGTLAVVKKMAQLDGTIQLLVQGIERVAVLEFEKTDPFLEVRVQVSAFPTEESAEVEALQGAVLDLVGRIVELSQPEAGRHISEFLSHIDERIVRESSCCVLAIKPDDFEYRV